jgi:opacity protein-like surface antigen
MPESVVDWNGDSSRVISWHRFRVLLTPDPARLDYRRNPQVLKDWAWLVLPIRMGYPAAPSVGAEVKIADVGNRSPYGFAFNAGWNRTSPGLTYPAFPVRRVGWLRSGVEDVLQPWYWLYVFRTPRYIPDWRGAGVPQARLEELGLAPSSGWGERGLGSTALGASITSIRGDSADTFGSSLGIALWRNLWVKVRYGKIELVGGYQKLSRNTGPSGSLFVYPFTANVIVALPEARFRPYLVFGGGAYGWESQVRAGGDAQLETPGWSPGWNAGIGLEYYLRPRVAFDVAVRYHQATGPEAISKLGPEGLRFTTIWIGHYVRF